MTKPTDKPAVTNRQLKDAMLRIAKRKVRDLFSISIPTKGMGWTDMKRDIERMKEALGLGRAEDSPASHPPLRPGSEASALPAMDNPLRAPMTEPVQKPAMEDELPPGRQSEKRPLASFDQSFEAPTADMESEDLFRDYGIIKDFIVQWWRSRKERH